jgi:EAL domain-containing protein (putative c-di-GMP-specific phosphodiesterase class I)
MIRTLIRNALLALERHLPQREAARPDDEQGPGKKRSPALQRLRHVGIAGGLGLLLGWSTILDPIDQITWLIQARMVDKEPSGEIVFVGLDPGIASSTSPQARRNLAEVLDKIRGAQPELVVLDVVFEEPSNASADRALREAIADYGNGIVLVQQGVDRLDGTLAYKQTSEFIAGDARQAPNRRYVNYLSYTWESYTKLDVESGAVLSVPSILSETVKNSTNPFKIDYRYNTYRLATWRSVDVLTQNNLSPLTGKKVVLGVDKGMLSTSAHLPRRSYVPASYVMIVAAETLIGGVPVTLPTWAPVVLVTLLLAACTRLHSNNLRLAAYGAIAIVCAGTIYFSALGSLIAHYGPVFFILVTYAILRIWWRARNRGILFDDQTNLQTFRALEKEFTPQATQTCTFIVARIHNFDEVLSVLPEDRHGEYIKLLSDRLRIADEDRQMYSGGGGYFAWTMPVMGRERLTDHLLGTRLLCYEPVRVDDHAIDIKVTFGVNSSADNSAARKLASARSAASRSNEADEPIAFVEHSADEEHLWNLSIQHKIDEAIDSGEIYPVFQPQYATESGTVVGVEALVRWKDPERGVVPTDWFIDQCEKAGRMERLTRLMLHESMRQLLTVGLSTHIRLSVNISAITLQDVRFYDMVRGALQATGFDPARLTLELTETWHIAKPELAASVMERVGALGVRWALDDFGVKTATYDALLNYPISEIKIDRSLTSKVLDLRRGRRIVRSICQMGAEMEVDVVAEGVESEAEFRTLREFGCPIVQGFVLAPPMPLAELHSLLSVGDTTLGMTP